MAAAGARPTYFLAAVGTALVVDAIALYATGRTPAAESWRRSVADTIVNACTVLISLLATILLFLYAGEQMDWRAGGCPPIGIGLGVAASVCLLIFARYVRALAGSSVADSA